MWTATFQGMLKAACSLGHQLSYTTCNALAWEPMLFHDALQMKLLTAEMEGAEWSGRATWLTSKHESQALTTALPEGSQEEQFVLPLDITIGFKPSETTGHSPAKRGKHRSGSRRQHLELSTTIGVKVVTR